MRKLLIIIPIFLLPACGLHNDPSWTVNPLDPPGQPYGSGYSLEEQHSVAWGIWGPSGNSRPYRPDAYGIVEWNTNK